jgi:hypothetical protein
VLCNGCVRAFKVHHVVFCSKWYLTFLEGIQLLALRPKKAVRATCPASGRRMTHINEDQLPKEHRVAFSCAPMRTRINDSVTEEGSAFAFRSPEVLRLPKTAALPAGKCRNNSRLCFAPGEGFPSPTTTPC